MVYKPEAPSIGELGLGNGRAIGGAMVCGGEKPGAPFEPFTEAEKSLRELKENLDKSAACRGLDPEMFRAAVNSELGKRAVKVCNEECPVLESCLKYAYIIGDNEFGIRAGLSARQRRALFKRSNQQGETLPRLDPIITRGKSS